MWSADPSIASTSLPRWLVKKAARGGVVAAWELARRLPGAPMRHATGALRVLTYHRFGPSVRDPFCVRDDVFETQMKYLREHDLVVSLADVHAWLDGGRAPRAGGVLVTIDDGCRSVVTRAAPVLAKYGIPAVVYVVAGAIGQRRHDDQPEPYMDWDEVHELVARGATIGSHAHAHRSLGAMSEAEAEQEGRRSRELLEDRVGAAVESFAYPFGTRADYGPATMRALARVGYRSAFTSQHGHLRVGVHPMALPRIKVEGGEGAWIFERLCAGGLDAWRFADRLLWRLQARAGRGTAATAAPRRARRDSRSAVR